MGPTIGSRAGCAEIPFGWVFGAAGYERVQCPQARARADSQGMRKGWRVPGLYFEEFEVGQRFEHVVHRTVTEADNVLFSTLTMNPAALHLDAEYCKGTPFGKPVVNSVFTLGLLVG